MMQPKICGHPTPGPVHGVWALHSPFQLQIVISINATDLQMSESPLYVSILP